MKISEFSIKRPITTLMVVFVAIILGVISLTRLNVDLLPNINLPIAVVSTQYSGAGPKEVEEIVTKNIESTMATVGNVDSIDSISSEGSSIVILQFNRGTDMDFATLEMREKLDLIEGLLPEGVTDPMVLKLDPNMIPVMSFGVSQQGKDISQVKLWVEDVLKPRLQRVDGVASVSISGGDQREIKVKVDPDRLAANDLSMSQIVNALRMENINAPGGIIIDGQYDLLVRSTGEFKTLDDIRNISITGQTGASFLLGDIARVEEGIKDSDQYSKINGQDSLSVAIQKESTANTVSVAQKVNKELESIKDENKDLDIHMIVDQSIYIEESISTVASNAIIGGVLAIIVLFVFLKNFRPTMVISTAIPISIIATFILVYFAGITLNMVSLGGLALGVGMLVDNAIVVLENIYRMRQEGRDRIEAATEGSSQVSMAIVASTLTTICVFLPIVFVQGITGEIFKELALTVTFSLLASLVVALTLVPMLCSKLLEKENFKKKNITLGKITVAYKRILEWALSHRKSMILITAAAFVASLFILPVVGAEYFPSTDQGQINISVNMPRGTTHAETVKAIGQVEELAADIPEVETIYASTGGDISVDLMGTSGDRGSVTLVLKNLEERSRSTSQVGDEIRNKVKNIPGCDIEVDTGGSMLSMGGLGSSAISIEIEGEDLGTLETVANDIVGIVRKVRGTRDVSSSITEGVPELRVVLDRDKAAKYGINMAMISSAVQSELQGAVATRYKVDGKELDVRVQVSRDGRPTINDMEEILISSPLGITIPIKEVADLEYDRGPVQIERRDQTRIVRVSAALSGRSLGDVMEDIQQRLSDYQMPSGYSINYGGENEMMTEAFSDLGLALILGIILVYMVMASQFESLLYPFIIMFTVPLAFTGAFLGLITTGTALSVPALLGMIVLAGVVVNNGIVMVDYINILRRDGMDRNQAILKAGPVRLRPILMTTLTTVLGLVPLALGFGEGAELQVPLAVTVIGGLSFSTILTLVVVPVVYTLFDDLARKFKSKPSSV
ncbi:MAG: efflux RND transporter permease subunit [Mahellales bacterium]|jgi:HAE1 family hydrophobic/amphiphilic exporter-1